ncbi:MAG: hypothetical protein ACOH2A_08770 [Sphingobacteriaceae bacterium]
MKKAYLPFLLLLNMLSSSCFDVVENYTFQSDGSCQMDYSYDMGKAISVLSNLLPDSVKALQEYRLNKDTTVNFYTSFTDSTRQHLDINEVQMAKSTDLLLKMDLPDNRMTVSVQHQAKSSSGLKYFLQNISSMASKQFDNLWKRKSKNENEAVENEKLIVGQNFYKYEISPKKFYRTIDTAKFNQYVKENEQMVAIAKAMLIDMPYKVVIHLPRAAKRTDNSKAVLSADKKQITIAANLDEALKDPTLMNFKIDY